MNIKEAWWFMGGGVSYNPETYFGNVLGFHVDPYNLSAMLQENAVADVPRTTLTIDTNPVGLTYNVAFGGHVIRSENDSRRPLLSSRDGFSYFSFDGTADFLRGFNTAKYLRKFHESASVYEIVFWLDMTGSTDGTAYNIFQLNGASSAHYGLSFVRTSGNKLECYVYYGAGAGLTRYDVVSTATINVASGRVKCRLRVNGNGASAGQLETWTGVTSSSSGSRTTQTFTVNAVGATNDCTNDLYIGSTPAPSGYMRLHLGDVYFFNRLTTDDEQTSLDTYALRTRAARDWRSVKAHYKASTTTRIFSDAAKTTTITNGTGIRAWESELEAITPFGLTNRDITFASAGVAPIWRTNQINSLPAAEWDGVDDTGVLAELFGSERGGNYLLAYVAKNEDAVNGSHVAYGSSYLTSTAENYSGNPVAGVPRFIIHPNGGASIAEELENVANAYNILIVRRQGSNISVWTGLGVKSEMEDINVMQFSEIGKEQIVGWWLDGFVVEVLNISGTISDSYVTGTLIPQLKTTYAI